MKQEPLPENFHELVVQARIDVDKHGMSATTFVLPIKWYRGLIQELSSPECQYSVHVTHDGMWLYGCRLEFGFIDAPIAAANLRRWNV